MLLVQGHSLGEPLYDSICSEYGGGGAGNGQREGWRLGAGISWRGQRDSELGICVRGYLLVIEKSLPFSLYSFQMSYSKECQQHSVLLIDKSSGQG